MEYQTIKEKGKVKFVVLPVEQFEMLLDRLEDETDILSLLTLTNTTLMNGRILTSEYDASTRTVTKTTILTFFFERRMKICKILM